MKKIFKFIPVSLFVAFVPMVAFAQAAGGTCDNPTAGYSGTYGLLGILCIILNLLDTVIPVIIALGLVYFIWGVVTYVIASDEEAKKTGKNRIIYGLIGLTIIISVWGLVNVLTDTFDIGGYGPPRGEINNLLP